MCLKDHFVPSTYTELYELSNKSKPVWFLMVVSPAAQIFIFLSPSSLNRMLRDLPSYIHWWCRYPFRNKSNFCFKVFMGGASTKISDINSSASSLTRYLSAYILRSPVSTVYWKSHQSHGFDSGGKVTGRFLLSNLAINTNSIFMIFHRFSDY